MIKKVCARCKEPRKLQSRNLCYTCYAKSRRDGTYTDYPSNRKYEEIICVKCKELKRNYAKGLCRNCYMTNRGGFIAKSVFSEKIKLSVKKGDVRHVKKIYQEERKKLLEDVINNPRKYLDDIDKGGSV